MTEPIEVPIDIALKENADGLLVTASCQRRVLGHWQVFLNEPGGVRVEKAKLTRLSRDGGPSSAVVTVAT